MIRGVAKAALALVVGLFTLAVVLVSWSGYRVTSAMNYGALRMPVAMCLDARHLELRRADKVPQKIVDQVLTRQIVTHYRRYKKRILPHSLQMLSSHIGWQTFWSADSRRRLYDDIERRMRPCPGAMKRYLQRKKMLRQSLTTPIPL